MKSIFKITDKSKIYNILDNATFGTLALSKGVMPYSIPINFVRDGNIVYFHGAKKGKKMRYLDVNSNVSFSVVDVGSLIQSYFSSKSGLACPATHFFSSVIIDGVTQVVEDYHEKERALELLMQKLQKEGKYKPLSDSVYKKAIDATEIIKILPYQITAKSKYGQNLPKDRFDMIIDNLEKRGEDVDKITIKNMKDYYDI